MEGVTRILEVEEPRSGFRPDVESGRSVAFVGPSGCKPTLAKLVSGLFALVGYGELRWLAHGRVPREVLTGSVAVVDQDMCCSTTPSPQHLPVGYLHRDYGDPAARDAGIHEVIM
ncbi:MAG: hypothetical protein ACLT98_05230 [Eggerthellaceae bacterium]